MQGFLISVSHCDLPGCMLWQDCNMDLVQVSHWKYPFIFPGSYYAHLQMPTRTNPIRLEARGFTFTLVVISLDDGDVCLETLTLPYRVIAWKIACIGKSFVQTAATVFCRFRDRHISRRCRITFIRDYRWMKTAQVCRNHSITNRYISSKYSVWPRQQISKDSWCVYSSLLLDTFEAEHNLTNTFEDSGNALGSHQKIASCNSFSKARRHAYSWLDFLIVSLRVSLRTCSWADSKPSTWLPHEELIECGINYTSFKFPIKDKPKPGLPQNESILNHFFDNLRCLRNHNCPFTEVQRNSFQNHTEQISTYIMKFLRQANAIS